MSQGPLDQLHGVRIAHLIESDGPGGAERIVVSLATALQAAGAQNVAILPAGGEGWLTRELAGTGVAVEHYHLDRPVSPAFARSLEFTLRRHKVHIAHSHEFTMAVYGFWAAKRAGIAHLITMHGSRYYAERLRRRLALRLAVSWSDHVIAVSRQLAAHLTRDLWLRPSRVGTIPNAVHLDVAQRSSLRAELGLRDGERLVVAIGNLYPVKGHEHLLEAFAILADRFPMLHVAIAGRGEREGALLARATELRLQDRFHLLGLRSDVPNLLGAADVFVLPSLSEGLPLALLEAMMARRPIVATDVGEVSVALAGGTAGVLVKPAEAPALAVAIAHLLTDSSEARRLGDAAGRRAAAEYALSTMVERYASLYMEMLGKVRRRQQRSHLRGQVAVIK